MELAYFSGYFRLKQRQTGGAGVIRTDGAKSHRNFSTGRFVR
jgi:hypothetical protein